MITAHELENTGAVLQILGVLGATVDVHRTRKLFDHNRIPIRARVRVFWRAVKERVGARWDRVHHRLNIKGGPGAFAGAFAVPGTVKLTRPKPEPPAGLEDLTTSERLDFQAALIEWLSLKIDDVEPKIDQAEARAFTRIREVEFNADNRIDAVDERYRRFALGGWQLRAGSVAAIALGTALLAWNHEIVRWF